MHILWLAILLAIPACTSREANTTDRTVTPLPPQVVTPVNPPPASQPRDCSPPSRGAVGGGKAEGEASLAVHMPYIGGREAPELRARCRGGRFTSSVTGI